MQVFICVHMCMCEYVHMHRRVYACVYVYMGTCVYTCVEACVCVQVYLCMCVHMQAYGERGVLLLFGLCSLFEEMLVLQARGGRPAEVLGTKSLLETPLPTGWQTRKREAATTVSP